MGVVVPLYPPEPASLDAYQLPVRKRYWLGRPCGVCGALVFYADGEYWDADGRWHNLVCEPKAQA